MQENNLKIPNQIFSFLFFFVKRRYIAFTLIALTSITSTLADSTIWPYVIGDLVDTLNTMSDSSTSQRVLDTMLMPLFIALFFWIFIELVQRAKGMLLAVTMPKFEADIRTEIFNYVSQHPHSYFVQTPIGGIAQRISDMPKSSKLIIDDILTVFIPLLISIIVSASVFFCINSTLSTIFLLWLSLHFGVYLFFAVRATNSVSIQSAARAALHGKIIDSMSNHLSVKIFTAHDHEMKKIKEAQSDEVKKYTYSLMYIEKIKVLLSIIGIVCVSVLFYSAVRLWQQHIITIGDIVFIVNGTIGLMANLWYAGDEISYMFYEMGVCKQSLVLLQHQNEVSENSQAMIKIRDGSIQFHNVSFTYRNNNNLFCNKSLIIKGGQKVGLVGFSGSGKTTFVNLIMRLYDITAGTIMIDSQDISKFSLDSLRSKISFIPQDPFLFHRSVKENIRYGNIRASDEEVVAIAQQAECHDFIMQLEHGYDTIVGERGSKLSGGQRQRIAIARAMLKGAPIIIMDEATSALDSMTEKLIAKSLEHLMRSKTVLIIAHRLSTLINLDRILVFDQGNILEDGTHEELLQKGGYYAKLWDTQQQGMMPEL